MKLILDLHLNKPQQEVVEIHSHIQIDGIARMLHTWTVVRPNLKQDMGLGYSVETEAVSKD